VKVRFINTYEPVSSFYRDLLPYLAGRGMEVEVLLSSAEYQTERPLLQNALKHPGIRIHYIPVGGISSRRRGNKVLTMICYALGTACWTLFKRGKYLNFFLSQPPLFTLWGYVLKVLRGQPYCSLVMDLYPDVAVQGNVIPPSGALTAFLKRLAEISLNNADALIGIGRCMEERLRQNGVVNADLEVIPNWADERSIYPAPMAAQRFRKRWGLEGKFIVLYSGNMGISHHFGDLLEVARRLRDHQNIRFLFIGDGIKRGQVEQIKETHALENVLILPFQPLESLPASLSAGNLHFMSLAPGFEGLVVPSKAYAAMAVGRPILYQGHPVGEIARTVLEELVGTVVGPGAPDALEDAVVWYYQNPDVVAAQGGRARDLALRRFSRKRAVEKYYSLIREKLQE